MTTICSQCQTHLEPSFKFCPECGIRLVPEASDHHTPADNHPAHADLPPNAEPDAILLDTKKPSFLASLNGSRSSRQRFSLIISLAVFSFLSVLIFGHNEHIGVYVLRLRSILRLVIFVLIVEGHTRYKNDKKLTILFYLALIAFAIGSIVLLLLGAMVFISDTPLG